MSTPTPHMTAKPEDVADTLIMPTDPVTAKYIAEHWLENADRFNDIRNMLGYTGTYRGRHVSVMGSGNGMPSMGIYSHELFHFYGVERIIKIGLAQPLNPAVSVNDIIVSVGACMNSNYMESFELPGTFSPTASFNLLRKAVGILKEQGLDFKSGNILSDDVYYPDDEEDRGVWAKMGVLAWEMETAALYLNAARAGKEAVSLLAVSDKNEDKLIEVALSIV